MTTPELSQGTPKEKSRFSRTEKLGIALALLIVAIMGYSYFFDVPLRVLFSLDNKEKLLATPIGTVTQVEGLVKRQRSSEFEFKNLGINEPVYPNDTIMTGPDSTATIVLKNGRVVRLTPNSLIKLTYGDAASKDGISIDVLKGGLADDAARMVPLQGGQTPLPPLGRGEKEVPLAVIDAQPPNGTRLSFTADEFQHRHKPVELALKLNRPGRLSYALWFAKPPVFEPTEIARVAVKTKEPEATRTFNLDRPGSYLWRVFDDKGEVLSENSFEVDPLVYGAIEVLPPLYATSKPEGGIVKNNFDGVTLRWKPLNAAGAYQVTVTPKASDKTIFTGESAEPRLRVKPDDLPSLLRGDPLEYQVKLSAENGFQLTSLTQELALEAVPPTPTNPAADRIIDVGNLALTNNLIFFTWTKTSFTTEYELELAQDASFKAALLTRAVRDNVHSITAPAPGTYFWRVRARAYGRWSEFSTPRKFVVRYSN